MKAKSKYDICNLVEDKIWFGFDHNTHYEEKLSISSEGFRVDGRAVDVGDLEEHDRTVYQAFKLFAQQSVQDLEVCHGEIYSRCPDCGEGELVRGERLINCPALGWIYELDEIKMHWFFACPCGANWRGE
jgi:hypothetical protein